MHIQVLGMMVNFSEYLLNYKDMIQDIIFGRVIFLCSLCYSVIAVFLNECVVWKPLGEISRVSGLSSSPSVWVGYSPSALTFPGNAS